MLIAGTNLLRLGLFLLVLGTAFLLVPPYANYCESYYANQEYCTAYEVAMSIGGIIKTNDAVITALATFAIAIFTWTIWRANQSQLKHARQVERAYLVGGGGPEQKPPHHFSLNVNNYGKTPASLKEFAVEACPLSDVKLPNKPKYLNTGYKRQILVDEIAPGQFKPIDATTNIQGIEQPVVYGRFWYQDIWKEEERYFSFILAIKIEDGIPRDSRADIDLTGIDPEYTKWT
jgi:hypothetical protein